jgi:hypothetical protein
MERLARRARAELFYFELDGPLRPRLVQGAYHCRGHILCRLRAGTEAFDVFMQ